MSETTLNEKEKDVLIKLLKAAGITVQHWGMGACMVKIPVVDGVYVTVQLTDIRFDEDYPHPGEA